MSLILTTATRKLELVLDAAVATREIPITVHSTVVREGDTNDGVYGCELNLSNGTADVVIMKPPTTGMNKTLRTLTLVNTDTAAVTVTIKMDDNGTDYNQIAATLQVGDGLYYEHEVGWSFTNEFGAVKSGMVEVAQDAVGSMILDTATIDLVYTDSTPSLEAKLIVPGTNTGDIIYRTGANAIGAEAAFNYDASTNTQTVDTVKAIVGLVVPKTSGTGIKVDTTSPTFPWAALESHPEAKGVGATDPNWAVYRGNIYQYQFAVNDEVWYDFTIPHDYVPGTDIWIEIDWSHNSTIVTGGSVTWGFDMTYAKVNNQAAFPATVNPTVSSNASTTQYQVISATIQLSATTPSGTQIDTDDLEPGGILLLRGYLSANNITSSGAVPDPFKHDIQLLYQSSNVGTKNKQNPYYT